MPSPNNPPILPICTTLIGFGAAYTGVLSLFRPVSAATIYGLPIPIRESLPTTIHDEGELDSPRKLRSYVYAHGLRNLSLGLAVMALTIYGHSREGAQEGRVVRKCLGIVLICGGLTPVGDVVITWGDQRGRWSHAAKSLVWGAFGWRCLSG